MASNHAIRHYQIEIGVIHHNGSDFAALGSTICGRQITAYLTKDRGEYQLTRWNGGTMLDCRSEVVEGFWNGGLALMFRLPRRRFIVGYALGDDGMLFRGELIDHSTEEEARRHCMMVSENWAELDIEDEESELSEV